MTESRFAEGEVSADRDADDKVRPLPSGHRLGEFELDSVLGIGGFGIVYRAFDRTLQRTVAVKEYMPAILALRAGDFTVGLRAQRFAHAFEAGRTAFLNEARLLAQFDHPGLLKVLHFWESHGTAYMVMPFYEGQTLAQRNQRPARMSEPELLDLFAALLSALYTLHRAQCFHRDISLDNILVQPGGQPVLLDFGAARKLIGDLVDETAMILKPGYAPIEQYTDDPAFKQGPWTDIYALGAVAYALVTGELPPAAVVRSIQDQFRLLAGRRWPEDGMHYSERFSAAIDTALALRIEDRPESVSAFAQLLGLREAIPGVFAAPDRSASMHAPVGARPAAPAPAAAAAASAHPEEPPVSMAVHAATSDEKGESRGASSTERPANSKANVTTASKADSKAESKAESKAHFEPDPGLDPKAGADVDTRPTDSGMSAMPEAAAKAERFGSSRRSFWPPTGARRFVAPALALVAIVVGGVTLLRMAIRPPVPAQPEPTAQIAAQLAAPQPVQARPVAPPAAIPAANAGTPALVERNAPNPGSVVADTATAGAAAEHAPVTSASSAAQSPLAQGAAPSATEPNLVSESPSSITARSNALRPVLVRLYVLPWGEVYVNGVKRGVSPPFRSMSLAPGTYRIEVRNGTLPPLVRTITLDAGESPVEIRYTFE